MFKLLTDTVYAVFFIHSVNHTNEGLVPKREVSFVLLLCVSNTVHACYNKSCSSATFIICRSQHASTYTVCHSPLQKLPLNVHLEYIFTWGTWMEQKNEEVSPQIYSKLRNGMQFTSKGASRCHRLFFAFKRNTLLAPSQRYSLEEEVPCVERCASVEAGLACLPLLNSERRDGSWQTLWSTSVNIRSSEHKKNNQTCAGCLDVCSGL